jgi:hypothetical protein
MSCRGYDVENKNYENVIHVGIACWSNILLSAQKWIQFEWPAEKTMGCVQFINGRQKDGDWQGQPAITGFNIIMAKKRSKLALMHWTKRPVINHCTKPVIDSYK